MNINFYYKGQTINIKVEREINLKSLFDSSLPKFDQHFYQELLLFSTNLRLRSKRTNGFLNFSDIVGSVLKDNDMIIVEPKENLTTSSQSIHAPKRYDLSNIDNYSPVAFKQSDFTQMKNNINSKPKNLNKYPYSTDIRNTANKYQKSDQSPALSKSSHNFSNPFNRTDLRRSLGADVAPQFDTNDYSATRANNSSTNYDSESSLSDFSNLTKLSKDNKAAQYHHSQTEKLKKLKSKSAPASPTKPAPPPRSPHTHMSMLNSYNVRTIGNKISISIVKKPTVGLGFTIVTRDNQVIYGSAADIANSVVILVNKILPNGGAAEDNRLRPGDRLLEVNGVVVKSLKEATEKLRAIPENEEVNLLISRVDRYETPSKEQQSGRSSPQQSIKQITFEIPLNQSPNEKQQLGLNIVCCNDRENFSMGPGIYIHSILPNSLASQQGGLRPNDKLLGINGRNLNDINVEETINKLKKVMQNDSILAITICRAIPLEQNSYNQDTTTKKEKNYYILPNKMSLDKKSKQSAESRSNAYSSRYSSSDSLSHSLQQTDQTSAFVRESKGRRSMSDKRKAHEDASQYTFYQETRLGDTQANEVDRLYSTLPTASRLKKMSNNQSPHLPNKTHVPVKPSQIKQLNTPKNHQEQGNKAPKTPNRSISLRNSPTRLKQPSIEVPQSPKRHCQTPTHDQPQTFNRAMNNSFKRAVQKSLPTNGQTSTNVNSSEKVHSVRRDTVNTQNYSENHNTISSSRQVTEKMPRSNSVKAPEDKKKNFNLKNFLTFAPNVTRTKSISAKEKSDTFPLNQQARYQHSSGNYNGKHSGFSTKELPVERQHCEDPVIVDSTKRVLEWQMKNDDVISKENKIKDQKIYHALSAHGTGNLKKKKSNPFSISIFACCSAPGKNAAEVNSSVRTPIGAKNTFHINTRSGHETDPYESIDGTLSSPPGMTKHKSIPSRSSHGHILPMSAKDASNSLNNRNTYQTTTSRKTSPPNDIYATVNKVSKKDSKSNKPPSNTSHSHINKYRF